MYTDKDLRTDDVTINYDDFIPSYDKSNRSTCEMKL